MNASKFIAYLTGALTLLLALFSFVLSFNALTDLATHHGVSIPVLFPLTVEAAVVIFSLNALYRSLHGESTGWQWVLIIGSSLLAGVFNILHAKSDLLSRAIAAMPSLFLLLSFETFLGQVRHAVRRSSVIQRIADLNSELEQNRLKFAKQLDGMRSSLRRRFDQERSKLAAELEQIQADLNAKRSTVQALAAQIEQQRSTAAEWESRLEEVSRSSRSGERVQSGVLNGLNAEKLNGKPHALNTLLDFYRSKPKASLNEAAQIIERSKGTVSNYLNELEQAGLIERSDSGVEVLTR